MRVEIARLAGGRAGRRVWGGSGAVGEFKEEVWAFHSEIVHRVILDDENLKPEALRKECVSRFEQVEESPNGGVTALYGNRIRDVAPCPPLFSEFTNLIVLC